MNNFLKPVSSSGGRGKGFSQIWKVPSSGKEGVELLRIVSYKYQKNTRFLLCNLHIHVHYFPAQ